MLLMRGMMTKFRLTNIFGNPIDYILGKFGKADDKDNKPEHEDASHDNVDDFNEDTCEVCLCDVHSTENNVEVQELFEDDRN